METNKACRVCGDILNSNNWYPSFKKGGNYICKECDKEKHILWCKNNPEKTKAICMRHNRKRGQIPMSENKECTSYLGVHITEHDIAENILNSIYKNVVRMPYGNPGYDFICDNYKIDAKSSCILNNRNSWKFNIKRNIITDYFLCIAFDNREYLNPMHIWLIPGHILNHLVGATISLSTLDKWSEYERNINDVILCCDIMKGD